jgi:hypothetical protein
MKAMTKQKLAGYAGVSVKTLMSWCKPYMKELEQMGLKPRAKILPPHIIKFIADKFTIIIENENNLSGRK